MESLPTKSTNVEKCRVHLEDGLPVWHAGATPVESEGVNTRISFSLQTAFDQNLSTSLLRLNPLGPLVDQFKNFKTQGTNNNWMTADCIKDDTSSFREASINSPF